MSKPLPLRITIKARSDVGRSAGTVRVAVEGSETIKGGVVPRYIPAVEAGAREAMEKGPLGFQVIDVGVTLFDGQYHAVDSSEHAFRTASRMGVRQALSEGAAVLMQPVFRSEIHIPSIYSGSLVQIVSALKGQVLGFDRDETAKGWDIFRALVPGGALDDLARALRSATQGIRAVKRKGRLSAASAAASTRSAA